MMLLPILPLSHFASSRCESFHLSNRSLPSVPGSLRPVSRTTLSGISANFANIDREGPWDSVAGTARMSLGSLCEYACIKDSAFMKNST